MKRRIALLLALAMFVLTGCGKQSKEWKEPYNLGVKYLSDGDYREAILSFSAAIEIAPREADPYVGRADAYIGAAAELAEGGIIPGTEQSQQILLCLQSAEADYETALTLAEAGSDLSTDLEVVEQKLAETTERKNQVAEHEENAAAESQPASEAPAEAPAVEVPEEDTGAEQTNTEVCNAYLALLEQERDAIFAYDWGYRQDRSLKFCQVAFYDVCGDETPELLLIRDIEEVLDGNVIFSKAYLEIYTCENGAVKLLFSEAWDWLAGGGGNYAVFTLEGEDSLYGLYSTDDSDWSYYYDQFVPDEDGMLVRENLLECDHLENFYNEPDFQGTVYYAAGAEISGADFDAKFADLTGRINCIYLFSGVADKRLGGHLSAGDVPIGGLTYDEAVAFLEAGMNGM